MAKIVLHQWEMSPFCNKVRRCLTHKGLDFEVENYNGLLARRAAKLSQVGTLPVLDHEGERIWDSTRIAERLDQLYPGRPLLPAAPRARAEVAFWDDWAAQSLYFFELYYRMLEPEAREKALDILCAGRPRWERAATRIYLKMHYPRKLREQGLARMAPDEVERRFLAHLEHLEALLEGRTWLVGDDATLADHAVAAQLEELVRTSRHADKIRSYPRISAWMAQPVAATR